MKNILSTIFIIIFVILFITGCQDRSNLTAPTPQSPISGQADLTRFVTIGNSITAGYQSSALFQDAQVWSYGNQIAKLVGTNYAIPLVSDPGLGGQIQIQQLFPNLILKQQPSSGSPLNLNYPAPYNNLGIPGAFLYDVLNAKDSLTCFSNAFGGQPNPLFNLILRGIGTQFQQARTLHPTLVTCWIGNNDVLGYATSGGFPSTLLTPSLLFDDLYNKLGDSLATLGAKVVLANIPEVTTIPFFTTVGPVFAASAPWSYFKSKGLPGFCYSNHEGGVTGVADSLSLATLKVLITLKGQSALAFIGDTTGAYYTVNHIPVPQGVIINYPFGLVPYNPFPDQYVLDPTEMKTASDAIAAFNTSISTVAAAKGFGLVDIHSVFNNIFYQSITQGGINYNGVNFTAFFITGGLFSLDGVHPSSQGQGVIANEFLKVINAKYGSNYPLINISTIPGTLNFSNLNLTGKFKMDISNWKSFTL
ncbi:MAG: SGNH/GDSL hydrolase family protein [Ignavibacteriaceae bacterium]|nr:SGNH/GDSL hydrolase family protein [Ignavibacteriaceae bacterium]